MGIPIEQCPFVLSLISSTPRLLHLRCVSPVQRGAAKVGGNEKMHRKNILFLNEGICFGHLLHLS